MYYACINNSTVENVIVAEPDFIKSWNSGFELVIECPSNVGIDYTYSEENGFQPPYVEIYDENIIDAEIIEPVQAIEAPTTAKK